MISIIGNVVFSIDFLFMFLIALAMSVLFLIIFNQSLKTSRKRRKILEETSLIKFDTIVALGYNIFICVTGSKLVLVMFDKKNIPRGKILDEVYYLLNSDVLEDYSKEGLVSFEELSSAIQQI